MKITFLDDAIMVNSHELRYWIDMIETDEYATKITGWAIIKGVDSWRISYKIDFKGASHGFSCKPHKIHRHDVTQAYSHTQKNYDESGFLIEIPRQYVGPDCYDIYFTLQNKESNEVLLSFPFMSTRIC